MQKGENISVAVALEIPSLAPNESKLSLAGSLGIIKKVLLTIFMVVFYFALCQSASAVPYDNTIGNKTISGTTFVVDGNQWIKEGNLTIGSGAILQINPGSSFQFELTHQINMSGGQIFQSDSDGIIKKGEVNCTCVSGACCDGCSFRPSTYACRVATGACDIAETCTGSSDICPADLYVTNNTQVTGCNGTCQACQSGACGSATVGTDPGSLCPINVQSAQGGDPNYCQQRTTDGLCNGAGACNGYGSWSNINEGLVCTSTGYCSGSTYYVNNTCLTGVCTGNAAGCCTGSYCSAGNYCRQSDHSCQPVPVCQVRNDTGFGTTNVTNNTQATGCNGTCQACQSGACSYATSGTDPGGLCPYAIQYAQGEDPTYCQQNIKDGNCNSTGACNGYGGWSNIREGLVCVSAGYCSGSTYYSGNTCSSGICTGNATGCCTGSYCAAGNYCRQSDHTCQPVPVCQVRNETGFGTTNVTNNTQVTNCNGTCQACQNGACSVATAGTDPGEKCGGYTCTGRLRGWSGTSCVVFSGSTAYNGMCGSGGSCASVADSCTGYGAQSGSANCGSEGCKNNCPFGITATGYDTVAEVCYTDSAQHSCSAGYACDSSGTCKKTNGQTCSSGPECLSGFCVNGYCCNSACGGNCDRCNVTGSLGTCTNVDADCTGNCDVCSAGNCAASNALCSNTVASCYCSGSGTSFSCQTCPDTYGSCGAPTCSSYTCGNDTASYNNTQPSGCNTACHYCSGGSCTYLTSGQGYGCTAAATTCSGADTCNSSGNCLTNDVTNNTQVTNCNGTCQACQSGVCNYATAGTDPGFQCSVSTQYQQGGNTYWCQQRTTDGNCNSSGACNGYGSWSNINQGQICASATSPTCATNCKATNLLASTCSGGVCPAQATQNTYATSEGAYPAGQVCINGSFTTATCATGYYCDKGAPYTCLDKYHPRQQAYGCKKDSDSCGPGIGECGYGSDCSGDCNSYCYNGSCYDTTANQDPYGVCTNETYSCSGNSIISNGVCGSGTACGYAVDTCGGGEKSRCVDGQSTCQDKCSDTIDNDGDGWTDTKDIDCGGCQQCTSGDCCNTTTACYYPNGTACGSYIDYCSNATTCDSRKHQYSCNNGSCNGGWVNDADSSAAVCNGQVCSTAAYCYSSNCAYYAGKKCSATEGSCSVGYGGGTCALNTACLGGVCSSSYRCDTSNYCHSVDDAYWNNWVCGPNTGSCNYVADKVDCAVCKYCSGGSCVNYTNGTKDNNSPNYCNGECQACQNGVCGNAADYTSCSGLGVCLSGSCNTTVNSDDPDCTSPNDRGTCWSNPGLGYCECSYCSDDYCDCDMGTCCSTAECCVPKTCYDTCTSGSISDGCGGTINCPCYWHSYDGSTSYNVSGLCTVSNPFCCYPHSLYCYYSGGHNCTSCCLYDSSLGYYTYFYGGTSCTNYGEIKQCMDAYYGMSYWTTYNYSWYCGP